MTAHHQVDVGLRRVHRQPHLALVYEEAVAAVADGATELAGKEDVAELAGVV